MRFADAHAHLGLYRKPLAAALEARFDHHLGPDARTLDVPPDAGARGPDLRVRHARRAALGARRDAGDAAADVEADRAPHERRRRAARPPRATACGSEFDEVAARLDDGRPYLCGDEFSAADLAFAALSAAVLVPERYGIPLPQPDELPEPYAGEVRAMREHPAGRFALRLYDQERP